MEDFLYALEYISGGMWVTLAYTFTCVGLGAVGGAVLMLMKMSGRNWMVWLARAYISVMRGTPLLIQLSFVYFVLPTVGIELTVFMAGVVAFSMNSAAYVAEIIRSGIQGVDRGQFEAARALGVGYWDMMRDIVFPQAFRNMLPALVNELVNLMKESAIIAVIGGSDLMRRAQLVAAEQYSYFMPLIIAGCCYYVMVLVLSGVANYLEVKMRKGGKEVWA